MTRVRVTPAQSVTIALVLAALAASARDSAAQSASPPQQYGRALFTGQSVMQNGGPPCASCHSISGIGFPNGGALGPDLSGVYQTLGSEGTDAALQTLFFPTMMPIYDKRPLTPAEQQALKAFLSRAGTAPVGQTETLVLGGFALAGFILLVLITWLAWRGRLRAVRAPLVARAGGARP